MTLDTAALGSGLVEAILAAVLRGDREAAGRRVRQIVAQTEGQAWLRKAWAGLDPFPDPGLLEARLHAAERDDAAALMLFAGALFGTGQQDAALAIARALAAQLPEQPAPSFLLCLLLLKRRDAGAQGVLQRCLEHFSAPLPGWIDIGQALLGLGKREAALVCFARGVPSAALALQQGLVARQLGRSDDAARFFEAAVRLDPSSPRAWFLLGVCAQDRRAWDIATAAYRSALDRDPALAEAAVNLGTVLQETGDLDGAKAAYGRAVATRADTFGRVAQALTTSPKGELWLDLGALRRSLAR